MGDRRARLNHTNLDLRHWSRVALPLPCQSDPDRGLVVTLLHAVVARVNADLDLVVAGEVRKHGLPGLPEAGCCEEKYDDREDWQTRVGKCHRVGEMSEFMGEIMAMGERLPRRVCYPSTRPIRRLLLIPGRKGPMGP